MIDIDENMDKEITGWNVVSLIVVIIGIAFLLFIFLRCAPAINVAYPKTNVYYENDSCDGFAFLGAAKAIKGDNWKDCLKQVINRKYRLNGDWKIYNTSVDSTCIFTYYAWVCSEFFNEIGKSIDTLIILIDSIGTYPSGMQRYCDRETFYEVPNVTSAAALIYARVGKFQKANTLLSILEQKQLANGNWQYWYLDNNLKEEKAGVQEDCYHIAMMLYQFQELRKFNEIRNIDKMYIKTLYLLERMALQNKMCLGSIGWGIPMTYLTIKNIDDNKYKQKTIQFLNHSNFRVRAISAWALSKKSQNI